jgi:hypothetical protein
VREIYTAASNANPVFPGSGSAQTTIKQESDTTLL